MFVNLGGEVKSFHIWSRLANVGTTASNPGMGPLQKSSLITPGAFSHGPLSQRRRLGLSFIHQKTATGSLQLLRVGDPAETMAAPLGVGVSATHLEPFKKSLPALAGLAQ